MPRIYGTVCASAKSANETSGESDGIKIASAARNAPTAAATAAVRRLIDADIPNRVEFALREGPKRNHRFRARDRGPIRDHFGYEVAQLFVFADAHDRDEVERASDAVDLRHPLHRKELLGQRFDPTRLDAEHDEGCNHLANLPFKAALAGGPQPLDLVIDVGRSGFRDLDPVRTDAHDKQQQDDPDRPECARQPEFPG